MCKKAIYTLVIGVVFFLLQGSYGLFAAEQALDTTEKKKPLVPLYTTKRRKYRKLYIENELLIVGFLKKEALIEQVLPLNQQEVLVINMIMLYYCTYFIASGGGIDIAPGKQLLYCIKIWHPTAGLHQIIPQAHQGMISSLSPMLRHRNNHWFVSAGQGEENALKIWDHDGQCKGKLIGHSYWVKNAKQVAEDYLISCGFNGEVKLWSIKKQSCIETIIEENKPLIYTLCVLFNNQVAYGTHQGDIIIRDLDIKNHIKTLVSPLAKIQSICIVQNKMLVAGDNQGKLCLWDIDSQKLIKTIDTGFFSAINCLCPYDDLIFVGNAGGDIQLWDITNAKVVKNFAGHANAVKSFDILAKCFLISGGLDGKVNIWDIASTKLVRFYDHKAPVCSICVI